MAGERMHVPHPTPLDSPLAMFINKLEKFFRKKFREFAQSQYSQRFLGFREFRSSREIFRKIPVSRVVQNPRKKENLEPSR